MVVNGVHPRRFSKAEAEAGSGAADWPGPAPRRWGGSRGAPGPRAAVPAPRLRRRADAPVVTLPFVFAPELRLEDLEALGRELERKLDGR